MLPCGGHGRKAQQRHAQQRHAQQRHSHQAAGSGSRRDSMLPRRHTDMASVHSAAQMCRNQAGVQAPHRISRIGSFTFSAVSLPSLRTLSHAFSRLRLRPSNMAARVRSAVRRADRARRGAASASCGGGRRRRCSAAAGRHSTAAAAGGALAAAEAWVGARSAMVGVWWARGRAAGDTKAGCSRGARVGLLAAAANTDGLPG